MKSIKDLTGKKFNSLEVLGLHEERDNLGKPLWLCKCECGKQLLIRTSTLNKGIISCGCKHKENIRNEKMVLNQKYAHYRRDALGKNIEFNLDKDLFNQLIQANCHYCNKPPRLWSPYIGKDGNPLPRYKDKIDHNYMLSTSIAINGIDRVNSDLGYNETNTVPCCRQCNFMKNIYTESEFLNQIKRIYEFLHLEEGTLIKI